MSKNTGDDISTAIIMTNESDFMMKILYLSPSLLPSRSANSIHVLRMCEAFSSLGHSVVLVCGRSVRSSRFLKQNAETYYGVDLTNVRLVSFYWPFSKGLNIVLGVFSFFLVGLLQVKKWKPDLIASRNLYASFLLQPFVVERLFFETHQVELGWRKYIQRQLIKNKRLHSIVISHALKQLLEKNTGFPMAQSLVLHDAAPIGIQCLSPEMKIKQRVSLFGENLAEGRFIKIAGYFGHLYPGRGIRMIRNLADRHPDIAFMIFGGNQAQIHELKRNDPGKNFMIMGYLKPAQVIDVMKSMDILLMPYQTKVTIGDNRSEISRYISPMKLFEYMACGIPIIASDLPSIREVLIDRHNCLLAKPNDVDSWSKCITSLCDDDTLAQMIAHTAHNEYVLKHDWNSRAAEIIHAIGGS